MPIRYILRALLAVSIVSLLLGINTLFATIQGIYRVSTYQIFDDGSFVYDVTIKVYNDSPNLSYFNSNWYFYTNDTTKIHVSGIQWTGPFLPYSGPDPWQPGITRTGFQRNFSVPVPAHESLVYAASYSGPSEYWSFGGGEGTFYGNGVGGADTPFQTFYVNLTFPNNASTYTIIQETSPHILLSTKPIKLRWIEYNVRGITDNVKFSGSSLTTSNPIITISSVFPQTPTINDKIIMYGYIKFPNGNSYVPAYGGFGVEDPLRAMTSLIGVDPDGTFIYTTSNSSGSQGNFFLFRFLLNYNNLVLYNYFSLPINEPNLPLQDFADINFEMSLYNHTTTFPATTDAFLDRPIFTPSPELQALLDAGATAATDLLSYGKAVWTDYYSSDVNKGILVGTGIACGSAIIIPNPASAGVCTWGVKTVGMGLVKSTLFVAVDKIIDGVPDNEWPSYEKEQAKILIRETTHLITFFLQPHGGGIKSIADATVLTAKMTELIIKSVRLAFEETDPQTNKLDGFILQCVDDKGDVYNIGTGKKEQNSVYFHAYSPVDLRVMDPLGRIVEKGRSDIQGARYIEQDLNGDGFKDDEIFLPQYVLGNYSVSALPEGHAAPTDKFTLTMNGSWLESTVVLAAKQVIGDNPSFAYNVATEKRNISGRFWFMPDTILSTSGGLADSYLEIPTGYNLAGIGNSNVTLNERLKPFLTDNIVTDVDSNGISERHFQFKVDSLVSLLGKTGGVCLLKVDYNSLNTITAQANIVFDSLSFDEIASLTATVIENDVELSWSMTAVSKTKCFEIERSEDGVFYQKIGVIETNPMTANSQYYFKDRNLPIGKHCYRLKQINLNGSFHYTQSVEVLVGSPQTYYLSQNYPNPFNSQTTIDYQLPQPGHVLLTIYNANGQEIIKLVDADKGMGHFTVNWEGKDSSGKKVTSGIYFYKIEVSGEKNSQFINIKKMVYLK